MKTYLTENWGLQLPFIGAPMTPAASGALAAAISKAGGLGMIGVSSVDTVEEIREEVALFRSLAPNLKFGLGFQRWSLDLRPDHVEIALELKPFMVSISFGNPAPLAERFANEGIRVVSQVQDLRSALEAEQAGVELLVAQGTEAGGHTGGIGTLPLLQIVLDRVQSPVIAAGGIHSARGFAAVIAAGAQGVWVGTPFLLAEEARVADTAREALIKASETDTVLTSAFDRVQQIPWPPEFKGRTLTNTFTARWHGHEDEATATPTVKEELLKAKQDKNYAIAHVYAGQSVGAMTKTTTAAEIVKSIAIDGEALLAALPSKLC